MPDTPSPEPPKWPSQSGRLASNLVHAHDALKGVALLLIEGKPHSALLGIQMTTTYLRAALAQHGIQIEPNEGTIQ